MDLLRVPEWKLLATSLAVFSNGHIDHRKGKMQIEVETSKLDQRRVFVVDDDEVTHAFAVRAAR
jgi:hypothetical protein